MIWHSVNQANLLKTLTRIQNAALCETTRAFSNAIILKLDAL